MNFTATTTDSEGCERRALWPEAGVLPDDSAGVLDRILTPRQAAEEYTRTWVRRRWAMLYSSLQDGPGRF